MTIALRDISGDHFQHIDQFFMNGFAGNELVEQSKKIDLPAIKIYSNEWYFDGIRMSFYDCHYKEPVDLKWNYDINIDLITFQANLKGSVFIGNKPEPNAQLFSNFQHNLFYSNAEGMNEGLLRCDDLRTTMFFIQFTKDTFLRLVNDADNALNRFSENIIQGRQSILSVDNLPLNARMLNLINNIVNCGYKNGLKKMYMMAKSVEFLVLQAETYNTIFEPSHKFIKTEYDKECIMHAREYLMTHLQDPPGLSKLARIAGINEYKLKKGFKELFGITVFGYLTDARLEIAKNDLLESDKTATEIAFELGYSSLQHFSNAFKKKYGSSPSDFRK